MNVQDKNLILCCKGLKKMPAGKQAKFSCHGKQKSNIEAGWYASVIKPAIEKVRHHPRKLYAFNKYYVAGNTTQYKGIILR